MHWESSGRYSESFQGLLFSSPLFFLVSSHQAVQLLEQSITVSKFLFSALAWKHSETACFHFSRGKAGLCFKSLAPPDVP